MAKLASMFRHSGPAISALSTAFFLALRASADAVPPPPENCPSGTVAVTSHSGPACEKEAPTNCPSGWHGQIGGSCVLSWCNADTNCQSYPGTVCKQTTLCFEPQRRTSTCGSNERARPGPELASPVPPVLAGPCAALPEPVTEWVPVNVCAGSEACAAPNECRPAGLCVEPSAPPPVAQPRNASGEVVPKRSGCGAGCVGAAGGTGSAGALTAIGVLALAVARWRRKL